MSREHSGGVRRTKIALRVGAVLALVGFFCIGFLVIPQAARLRGPGNPIERLGVNLTVPEWWTNVSALISSEPAQQYGPSHGQLLELRRPPKVALMFLTPGPLPHEGLWTDWLAEAEGLVPISFVDEQYRTLPLEDARLQLLGLQRALGEELEAAGGSSRGGSGEGGATASSSSSRAPRPSKPGATALERQFLYSLYVHTHPSWPGYPEGSMYHGHVIDELIVAKRMHHSLVEAEKLLLKAALSEPLNENFVLISESHVPLYPPTLTYLQLLAEGLSRLDACNYKPKSIRDNLDRWHPAMSRRKHWRKTSQWFSLIRSHADLVAHEVEMNRGFQKHCRPRWDNRKRRFISCSDNEHYPAVVLAAKHEGHATSCWAGGTTYVDWTRMDREGRPRSFWEKDVSADLFHTARRSQCNFVRCEDVCASAEEVELALVTSDHAFVPVSNISSCCDTYTKYMELSSRCPIFIRKFHNSTTAFMRDFVRPFVKYPNMERRR